MIYATLEECLLDLEKKGELVRVKEQVEPHLEMAAIHLRVHEKKGPALLFENIKGTSFRAASNIFGTAERSKYIFRNTLPQIEKLLALKDNPLLAFQHPLRNSSLLFSALKMKPKKTAASAIHSFKEINIQSLPLIQHWPKDGGAFITLPQVYTEDADTPGIQHSNLGMYRIQLSGNEYILNKEVGLHYQIHRGIGVHQTKANKKNIPLKVSVFIGGPPAHTLAAIMPLPEGFSEINFAGALANRRFHYTYYDDFCISTDADFIITGEVLPGENKPEGPFGDHLGYYSLQHPFPVMQVKKVFARKKGIWPFTVVGRPPQEDTSFGNLIHSLTGKALEKEIPGLQSLNAVDAAGVHPLLLAVGSERYTPYLETKQPSELLTIANRILGTGQLSLAKFLFITAGENERISAQNIPAFMQYFLQRINLERDIHFYTNTSIDTLDYSGTGLNRGSKVVFAAYGNILRETATMVPDFFHEISLFKNVQLCLPGIVCAETNKFSDYTSVEKEIEIINEVLQPAENELKKIPLIVLCDDADFCSASLNNFLWVSFTRCNPSHDIHGIGSFIRHKHWGAKHAIILDARIKPHHAPPLEKDAATENKIDRLFAKGGSLYNVK